MGPEVFADRATLRASRIELHDWRAARDRLRRTASHFSRRSAAGAVLITDVRDCFASMGPAQVRSALERLGADEEAVVQVVNQLRSFVDRGVSGLPVGPAASAVLANAVLCELDRSLRGIGLPYTRWVDDVMVFAPDRSTAVRASVEVRRTLERIGLEANEAKTWILEDRREASRLLGTRLSPTGGAGRVP
jgi:Reverse transcriptase (RNA-dependent DNA polymerase)